MQKPYAERPYRARDAEARALIEVLAAGGDLAELMPRIKALAAAYSTAGRGATEASVAAALGARRAATEDYHDFIFPVLRGLRQEGIRVLSQMTNALNARNIASFSGKPWKLSMVQKVCKKLDAHDGITHKEQKEA